MADAPTVAPQTTDQAPTQAAPTQAAPPSAEASQPTSQDTNAPEPGGATAPASALPPSTSSGLHGVLAHVALGALAGAVSGIKKVGSGLKKATPYIPVVSAAREGAIVSKQLNQEREQKMQQSQTASMDEHQVKQLAVQTASLDNLHKIAENQHIETMYPDLEAEERDKVITQHRAQDEADRAFLTHLAEAGVNIEHKPFSQFSPVDGKAVGSGQKTVVNNGQTGTEAGGGFVDNRELETTVLPHNLSIVSDWTLDDKGTMTPTYRTLKAGENTAMDALIGHDAGMDKFNQLQKMYQDKLKTQEQAATTLLKQKEAAFGPMPKDLNSAVAQFTRASEAYSQNPTPENKQVYDNAKEMRQSFFSAESEKARVEEAAKEGDPSAVSQMLVDGTLAPSQLPGRFRPEFISKVLTQAKVLSQAQGKEFNPKAAEAEYSYARSPQTQNTLNMIEAILEPGGSLDIAKSAALNLPAMDQKTANKVFNATATEFGSDEATRFHTAMLGLADEYAKVMGGGTATDSGRQQGLDILKQDFSRGQLDAGIETILADVHARGRAIVGKNSALNAMYPNFAEKGLPQTPPTRPTNVSPQATLMQAPGGQPHWVEPQNMKAAQNAGAKAVTQ